MKSLVKKIAWVAGIMAVICFGIMLICNLYDQDIPQDDTTQSFLGKPIILNGSLCEQIAAIAEQDKILSYGDSILQIGDVKWRINVMPNGIALMTSVQPDDPKMKQVVKYLNSIYGNPYDGEDVFSLKWLSSDKLGSKLVHLRRVNSEGGGTFLLFN